MPPHCLDAKDDATVSWTFSIIDYLAKYLLNRIYYKIITMEITAEVLSSMQLRR